MWNKFSKALSIYLHRECGLLGARVAGVAREALALARLGVAQPAGAALVRLGGSLAVEVVGDRGARNFPGAIDTSSIGGLSRPDDRAGGGGGLVRPQRDGRLRVEDDVARSGPGGGGVLSSLVAVLEGGGKAVLCRADGGLDAKLDRGGGARVGVHHELQVDAGVGATFCSVVVVVAGDDDVRDSLDDDLGVGRNGRRGSRCVPAAVGR